MSTLADLKKKYYADALGVNIMAYSLSDLEYMYFSNPPNSGGELPETDWVDFTSSLSGTDWHLDYGSYVKAKRIGPFVDFQFDCYSNNHPVGGSSYTKSLLPIGTISVGYRPVGEIPRAAAVSVAANATAFISIVDLTGGVVARFSTGIGDGNEVSGDYLYYTADSFPA